MSDRNRLAIAAATMFVDRADSIAAKAGIGAPQRLEARAQNLSRVSALLLGRTTAVVEDRYLIAGFYADGTFDFSSKDAVTVTVRYGEFGAERLERGELRLPPPDRDPTKPHIWKGER